MNGPENYREAERLLEHSKNHTDTGDPRDQAIAEVAAAQAQVHAQLAEVAAFVEQMGMAIRPLPGDPDIGDPPLPGNPWGRALYGDPS